MGLVVGGHDGGGGGRRRQQRRGSEGMQARRAGSGQNGEIRGNPNGCKF